MNTTLKLAGVSALGLAMAACATAPDPSPRLLSAEQSLTAAQQDANTLAMGRSSLEKAEASLTEAREAYMKRKDQRYIHHIRMTEGYIELAETRGDQRTTEQQIERLKSEREDIAAEKRRSDLIKAEEARRIAEEEAVRAKAQIEQLKADLESERMTQTDDGMTLVLQDLQFATGSATLLSGAQGRLQPLAEYLSENDEARIRVEGHTDSQGSDSFNLDLSTRRAEAVGSYLSSQGIDADRIETVGRGEANPIAANDTQTGRAQNRRVEITILN